MTTTPRTRCFMHMAPLLMLSDSFVKKGITERVTVKRYMAEKKRLEKSSSGI